MGQLSQEIHSLELLGQQLFLDLNELYLERVSSHKTIILVKASCFQQLIGMIIR